MAAAGAKVRENANKSKYMDCEVFQYAYVFIENSEDRRPVDTARAVYVPTGKNQRVWKRSWISRGAHIQVCVREPARILVTWLYYSEGWEETDGNQTSETETAENRIELEDQEGGQESQKDADDRPNPIAGQSEPNDPGTSGPSEEEAR